MIGSHYPLVEAILPRVLFERIFKLSETQNPQGALESAEIDLATARRNLTTAQLRVRTEAAKLARWAAGEDVDLEPDNPNPTTGNRL